MKYVFRLHKWFGLAVGGWILVQALTGTAMLFRAELNRLLHDGVLTVEPAGTPLPVDRWMEAAHRAQPEAAIERIDYPVRSGDAVLLTMQCPGCGGRRLVAVNPYNAEVTASGGLSHFPVEAAFWLHSNLWLPPTGKYVVGALGLVVVGMAGTGLWMWWPRRGAFRRAFRIVRNAGRLRLLLDLHRVPGALASVAILFVASMGVLLSYSGWLAAALRPVMPFADPLRLDAPRAEAIEARGIEPLVDVARSEFPESKIRDVRWSAGRANVVQVLLHPDIETIPRAAEQVFVRQDDGAVLARVDPAKLPSGDRLIRWLLPLHSGHFGNGLGTGVSMVAGLGLLALGVTGLWMWFARRAQRAAAAVRAAAVRRPASQ